MMDKNYKNVEKFKLMCAKIIPLVYEDSLSYYEFLCKVLGAVNQLIENGEILEESFANLNENVGTFDSRITANAQNIATYKQLLDEDIDKLASLTDGADGVTIKELVDKFGNYYTKDEANARFAQLTYLNNNFVKQTNKAETLYGVNASGVQQSFEVTRNARPQSVARYKVAGDDGFGTLAVGAGILSTDAVNVGQMNEKLANKETVYNNTFVRKQPGKYNYLYGTNSGGSDVMYEFDADAATGYSIAKRTSNGRLKANDPVEGDDVVTKNYLNTITDLDEIAAAVDKVNEAAELANAAADAANEAATTAAGYEARIVNIENSVTAVDGRAQSAQTTASGAAETAATALGIANSASSKADEANTLASSANTNANAATTNANEAKATAANAATAAQNATDAANQMANRITTIEGEIDEKIDKRDVANAAYVNDEGGEPSTLKYTYTPSYLTPNYLAQYDNAGVLHSVAGGENDPSRVMTLMDTSRRLYYKTGNISLISGFELGRKFGANFATTSINRDDLISITITYRNDGDDNDTTTLKIPVVMGSGSVAFSFPFKRVDTGAIEPRVGVIDIKDAGGEVIVIFYGVADDNYLKDIKLTRATITFRNV